MIAVLKNGTTPSQIQHLVDWLKNMNLDVHISEGSDVYKRQPMARGMMRLTVPPERFLSESV